MLVLVVIGLIALNAWALAADSGGHPPHDDTVTQGDSAADRAITAEVQSRLTADPALSDHGRRIDVVTADGVVYLRGPVASAAARAAIEAEAKRVSGVHRVTSTLLIPGR